MRKYSKIFRVSLVERMAYRGDFLLGTILRFLPMVTTILLWQAIYDGLGASRASAGFSYREMIAYLLLTQHQPDVLEHARPGRRDRPRHPRGDAQAVPDPADRHDRLPARRTGSPTRWPTSSRRSSPTRCCSSSAAGYFDGFPDAPTLAAYAVSLVLAFLVGLLLRGERRDGRLLVPGGDVAALHRDDAELLHLRAHAPARPAARSPGRGILKVLPFQYMAYFPAVVFLGKVKGWDLVLHLLGELALGGRSSWCWPAALYRLGLRRYSAFGG